MEAGGLITSKGMAKRVSAAGYPASAQATPLALPEMDESRLSDFDQTWAPPDVPALTGWNGEAADSLTPLVRSSLWADPVLLSR